MLMEFLKYGTPEFSRALRSFLSSSTEYLHFNPWYRRHLASMPNRRKYVAIGPGVGGTTKLAHEQFKGGIAVEPTADLHPILTENCPGVRIVHGSYARGVDLLQLKAMDPGAVDLVEYLHVAYYQTPEEIDATIDDSLELLEEGGTLVAAIQDEASGYSRMYEHFVGRGYGLKHAMEQAARKHKKFLRSIRLPGQVIVATEDEAVDVATFMLGYVPFSPLPTQAALRDYVRTHFLDGESGTFVTKNPQRVYVLEK